MTPGEGVRARASFRCDFQAAIIFSTGRCLLADESHAGRAGDEVDAEGLHVRTAVGIGNGDAVVVGFKIVETGHIFARGVRPLEGEGFRSAGDRDRGAARSVVTDGITAFAETGGECVLPGQGKHDAGGTPICVSNVDGVIIRSEASGRRTVEGVVMAPDVGQGSGEPFSEDGNLSVVFSATWIGLAADRQHRQITRFNGKYISYGAIVSVGDGDLVVSGSEVGRDAGV